MSRSVIIFIALFNLFHFSQAQKVCSFDLYFDSDSHQLSPADKQKADSITKSLSNIPGAYSVSVYGHTDNEGNIDYNKKLSLDRATAVKSYLGTKGFDPKKISVNAYAYTKPAATNANETGKSKNRRVNVCIFAIEPDLNKIITGANPTQVYSVNINDGAKLKYKSGTEIIIPPNAFTTMDGKDIKGNVTVKYTEYRDALDFIKSGIPMSFHDQQKQFVQFNSGGMFKIEATAGEEQLKLKDNSKIKINFVKTQELPGMKFYSLDTIHNSWLQDTHNMNSNSNVSAITDSIAPLNPAQAFSSSRYGSTIVRHLKDRDSCLLYPCSGTLFAARKGLALASSSVAVHLNHTEIYFEDVPDPRNFIATYAIKIISYNDKKVEFQIIPGQNESILEEFKDYHWVYENGKRHPFKKEWEKMVWLRVKLEYLAQNDFYLTFYSNGTQFTIAVKAKYKPQGWSNEQVYSANGKNSGVYMDRFLEQVEKRNDFQSFLNNYIGNKYLMDANYFRKACNDSLFCLYSYNKQWMNSEEDKLNCKEWYDYFNANKKMMIERYQKALANKQLVATECLKEEEALYAETKKNARRMFVADSVRAEGHKEQENTINSMVSELSITSLGIWNCDQVERLKKPVYVKRKYKTSTGQVVEPVVIYVIDKAVNGTLTYNGYMDLSPYYFPVSSKSENTLIAFDIKNRAYICRADKMKTYVNKDFKSDIILEPLSKAGEQIAAALK